MNTLDYSQKNNSKNERLVMDPYFALRFFLLMCILKNIRGPEMT